MKLVTSATIPKVDSFGHAQPSGRIASSQRGQLAGTPEQSASIPGAAQPFDLLLSLLIESSMSTGAAPAAVSPVTAEVPSPDDRQDGNGAMMAAALPLPSDSVPIIVTSPFAPAKQEGGPSESLAAAPCCTKTVVQIERGPLLGGGISPTGSPAVTDSKTTSRAELPRIENSPMVPASHSVSSLLPPANATEKKLSGSPTGESSTVPPTDLFDLSMTACDECVRNSAATELGPIARGNQVEVERRVEFCVPALEKSWTDRLQDPSQIERTSLVIHHDPEGNGSDQSHESRRETTNESDSHSATNSHSLFEHSQASLRLDLPLDSVRLEPQSVAPMSVFDQLSATLDHQFEQRASTEPIEFRMRLDSPELGIVHVHVSVIQDAVSLRLVASGETARRLIESQLSDLQQSLGQWGLSFGQCDVSCGGGRKHEGRHEFEAPVTRSKTSSPSVQWTGQPHTSHVVNSSNRLLDYLA